MCVNLHTLSWIWSGQEVLHLGGEHGNAREHPAEVRHGACGGMGGTRVSRAGLQSMMARGDITRQGIMRYTQL
jgi:hypothetical protein